MIGSHNKAQTVEPGSTLAWTRQYRGRKNKAKLKGSVQRLSLLIIATTAAAAAGPQGSHWVWTGKHNVQCVSFQHGQSGLLCISKWKGEANKWFCLRFICIVCNTIGSAINLKYKCNILGIEHPRPHPQQCRDIKLIHYLKNWPFLLIYLFVVSFLTHLIDVITEQQPDASFLQWGHCLEQLSGLDSNVSSFSSSELSITTSLKTSPFLLSVWSGQIRGFYFQRLEEDLHSFLDRTHPGTPVRMNFPSALCWFFYQFTCLGINSVK